MHRFAACAARVGVLQAAGTLRARVGLQAACALRVHVGVLCVCVCARALRALCVGEGCADAACALCSVCVPNVCRSPTDLPQLPGLPAMGGVPPAGGAGEVCSSLRRGEDA